MKNGEKIDVDEMDINHLKNTLKMIFRNRQKALQATLKPKVEFRLEGDMANFAATNSDGIAFWFEKKPSLEPLRWAHMYNDKLAYVPHSPKIKGKMTTNLIALFPKTLIGKNHYKNVLK